MCSLSHSLVFPGNARDIVWSSIHASILRAVITSIRFAPSSSSSRLPGSRSVHFESSNRSCVRVPFPTHKLWVVSENRLLSPPLYIELSPARGSRARVWSLLGSRLSLANESHACRFCVCRDGRSSVGRSVCVTWFVAFQTADDGAASAGN